MAALEVLARLASIGLWLSIDSRTVLQHDADAFRRSISPGVVGKMLGDQRTSSNWYVVRDVVQLLGRLVEIGALSTLFPLIDDSASFLGGHCDEAWVKEVESRLRDPNEDVKVAALDTFKKFTAIGRPNDAPLSLSVVNNVV